MKKLTLLLLTGLTVSAIAQNIDENKVNFGYVQLPESPIEKQYSTYNVIVERNYERANEDSLIAYQNKLVAATSIYETNLNVWNEQKRAIQRDYLVKMAGWQKATDLNQTVVKPTDPVYPPKPMLEEVIAPRLHGDITDEAVTNLISIDGYTQGTGGATVSIGINPVSNVAVAFERKVTGTTVKYDYHINYQLPITIKVETPSQGIILNTIIQNNLSSYNMPSYASQYEFDLWWLDNESTFWPEFEKNTRASAMTAVKNLLNEKCGYPVKTRVCEVYTVKSHKDHVYNDLTNAYTAATAGYMSISGSLDHSAASPKLNEAISIWLQMLSESDLSDNKSRINDKVTALLYCNLAEAYCWLNDFDKAYQYLNLAKNSGEGKFRRIADRMTYVIDENQKRFNANK
jgi:hypothetical protein